MRVIAATHPLRSDLAAIDASEGRTLEQILAEAQPDPVLRAHAHIFVGDVRVPRERWSMVRPKSNSVVTIHVVAQGGGDGGKNPLRTVLTIAVVVAATMVAGPAGTALGSQLAGAAVAAAVTVGGNLLINAIAPVRQPSLDGLSGTTKRDSPTLSIEGARNNARPFGTVPVVLGRHRHVPPLGAQTYTEVVGDDQYLRMLVVWGYGPLKIEDLRIGDTPITSFDGVRVETREGRAGDAPVTLYPDTVDQVDLGITLKQADSWQQRTTSADTDEISIDVANPRGLVQFDDRGKRQNRSVTFQVQYREAGTPTWLAPSFVDTTVDDSWISGDTITLTHRRTSAIRHGFRWSVPRGQYEVRGRRTTTDTNDSQISDTLAWSALRSITNEDPIQFAHPLAVTALSIKATDQLNRVVDQLTATVSSYVEDWDGSETVSSNPALLYRHVLQGNANARRLTDERVDLAGLEAWDAYCGTQGFEFSMIRDFQASVWDTLADIAAAGRASPSQKDGKWGVTVDQPQSFPVQHLTPRNSWGFEAEKSFPDPPHAFRVRFASRESDWQQDERIVYADGYDATNAEVFETLDAPGITDPDHVWSFARFHLAQAVLRPERWTLNLDFEHLVARRGSLVRVTHDVLLVGLASGRIKEVLTDGSGNATGFVSDEVLTMEAGKTYGVSIRTVDDAGLSRELVTAAGDQTTVTFASAIPAAAAPAAGDLFGFGESGKETVDGLVLSIEPQADFVARLVLIPYSPAVYDADTGTIPAYDPGITPLPDVPDAIITEVRSDESVLQLGTGSTLIPHIAVSVDTPTRRDLLLDVHIRATGTGEPYVAADVVSRQGGDYLIGSVEEGQSYDIRVRWNNPETLAVPGRWATEPGHRVIGKSTPPTDVTGFTANAARDRIELSWNKSVEPDIAEYEIREGTAWDTAALVAQVTATAFQTREPSNGPWLIKARDTAGNVSVNATQATISVILPTSQALSAQVIDNNVLLRWNTIVGTFRLDTHEILKGDALATAEVIGESDKTFDIIQELQGGTYTYWIVPIDEAGNEGAAVNITTNVDNPPDFVLSGEFQTDWQGLSASNVTPQLSAPLPARLTTRDFTALEFDGVDDYVAIDHSFAATRAAETVEYLFQTTSDGIIASYDASEHWRLEITPSGLVKVSFVNAGAASSLFSTGFVADGRWHHVAFVYDGAADQARLLVDGVAESTLTLAAGDVLGSATTRFGFLGVSSEATVFNGARGPESWFDGRIAEARLWSVARTNTEIANNMDRTLDGNETGLVGYWRMQSTQPISASAKTLPDKSGNGNDGTIFGAVRHALAVNALVPWGNWSRDELSTMGYGSRDDMIAAGLDYRGQPTPDTAQFVEVYDAGTVIASTQIQVTLGQTAIVGSVDASITISIRQNQTDAWTDFPVGQNPVFATSFRYVKVTVDYSKAASDDTSFLQSQDVKTALSTKIINDSGTVDVQANPTTVNFNVDFVDVQGINTTPQGTTPLTAVVDFADTANPTSFDIYLFDGNGNPATGTVRWSARGS